MRWAFLDTNVLVDAFSTDPKAAKALEVLGRGGVVSVQNLNEFANVARRKLGMDWNEIRISLAVIRAKCGRAVPLDDAIHADGLRLAERYGFAVYDAMIVAAALAAGCDTLYSEDMHAGLVVDRRLTIVNPFA